MSKKEKLSCCGGEQASRSGVQKQAGGCLNLPWITARFQPSTPNKWLAEWCAKVTFVQGTAWMTSCFRLRKSVFALMRKLPKLMSH